MREGEEKIVKVALYNEEKSDSYKGLENVYGAGEGSEVKITEKSMMTKVWMIVKNLPYWKW